MVAFALVLESEVNAQSSCRSAFERLGYLVLTVATVEQALEVLRKFTGIQVVLTNIETCGEPEARKFTADVAQLWPQVRQVLTSDQQASPRQPPSEIAQLSKPYSMADLSAAISGRAAS